ncbi:unnamed protein product [Brassica rapa subsp. trilocularis]
MDRRSWLWRRKSSEKSPGETESTGSLSSHSERFSDDQRSHSPELISKPVTREEEKELEEEEATADIKILTERLSAALLNVSLKDDLAKQHAKVAEEAVAGWEKAENEAAALKQQLDASVSKVSALEDRNTHLDSALKECVRQLWQGREEQNQKIEEAINKKCSEWEATKAELESRIEELQARLQTGKQEDATALEKENSALKLELLSKAEEVKILTLERDLSTQAAESASKQHLEGIKKLTKLEVECRKLRVMVQRSVKSNELKSSIDNQSDYSGRFSFSDNEVQSPTQRAIGKTPSVDIGLMDDFLEMEKLASMPRSEPGRKHSESKPDAQSKQLKHELETSLHRISELEEKVEMVEVEKLQLEMALNESKEQVETLQSRLMETEERLKKLEPKAQDLELALSESRKQIQDLQRQLNRTQADKSKLETTRAENNDLELLLSESGSQIQDLQKQLNKAQVNLSELETIRAEKLELTICLNGTKKELETSQSRLKETERKLTEVQTLLRLTKDAKEAAEDGVKAANAKAEAVESRLRDVEAEAESLILKIESLEESVEKERVLSAKHSSKCEELQDEISKLKHKLEHHGEGEHEPNHLRAFDDDYKLKQGKVALVTGGDSGIGRAVCHCYVLEGASVAFTYVKGREDKDADETLRLLHEAKTKDAKDPIMIATDLGFEENCKRTVDEVVNAFGRIDVLVNCAAEQHEVSIDEIEEARLERVFRTNIFSQFFLAKYALKHMKEGSSIINTTSVVAYAGSSSLLEYASTKGAIVSFTRALALQLASKGIRVNGVAPGPVWTPLITASFSEEAIKQFGSETPMKRAAQPVEVAPSYVFLACEHCSSYYTGQILHPNGKFLIITGVLELQLVSQIGFLNIKIYIFG